VLVPPTSITAHVSLSERKDAPTRLAAGPVNMDSMGLSMASLMFISEPSHFSIMSFALIPLLSMSEIMAFMNCVAMGISWALRYAVTPLS